MNKLFSITIIFFSLTSNLYATGKTAPLDSDRNTTQFSDYSDKGVDSERTYENAKPILLKLSRVTDPGTPNPGEPMPGYPPTDSMYVPTDAVLVSRAGGISILGIGGPTIA